MGKLLSAITLHQFLSLKNKMINFTCHNMVTNFTLLFLIYSEMIEMLNSTFCICLIGFIRIEKLHSFDLGGMIFFFILDGLGGINAKSRMRCSILCFSQRRFITLLVSGDWSSDSVLSKIRVSLFNWIRWSILLSSVWWQEYKDSTWHK